jgi:hypothetical protein
MKPIYKVTRLKKSLKHMLTSLFTAEGREDIRLDIQINKYFLLEVVNHEYKNVLVVKHYNEDGISYDIAFDFWKPMFVELMSLKFEEVFGDSNHFEIIKWYLGHVAMFTENYGNVFKDKNDKLIVTMNEGYEHPLETLNDKITNDFIIYYYETK